MSEPPCRWREDYDGTWWTDCDRMFVLADKTPHENGMKFCAFCGKPLIETPYEEEDIDDE